MTALYKTRLLTAEAVQWDGANVTQVRELTGDNVAFINDDGTLTIATPGRENRRVLVGWWVSRNSDGTVTTHSADAFSRLYEHVAEAAGD